MKNTNIILLLTSVVALLGCAVNFDPPQDEALEACRKKFIGTVEGHKTPITCEAFEENGVVKNLVPVSGQAANWRGVKSDSAGNKYMEVVSPAVAPTPSNLPGLIVLVEVGTFPANEAIAASSPFSAMMNDKVPKGIQDNIRMFMSNFTKAFLDQTVDRVGKRYGNIYFVKSDVRLKEIFLQTLKKATSVHPKVDLLLIGHGEPGEIILNKDLKSTSENLTGQELIDFAKNKMDGKNDRVRAIFQTHCFTFVGSGTKMSIFKAYEEAFPMAEFYGGKGINSFPLHRDVVAFEKYYENMNSAPLPFYSALLAATNFIGTKLNGEPRQILVFPAIKGRGCISIVGFDKCKSMAQATGWIYATYTTKTDSIPNYGQGRILKTQGSAVTVK